MRADDALKYAAARLEACADWVLDSIGGSMCDREGHEDELNAIADVVSCVAELAARFGDPRHYSNGRLVKTRRQIEDGLVTEHIWHPESEPSQSWRGSLPSGDPDVPSPGVYEVTTYPETQQIHVRVVRTA
ncbi:hypothetical protein E2F47_01755 [Mycobacterium eburneum]|nr:hypothetical protein [Mycobacterium eburneum]TDH57521.1 hypothetical protein E2F47_01755 [Mycobacterium eburneum]